MELSLILFTLTQLCVPKKAPFTCTSPWGRAAAVPGGSWSPGRALWDDFVLLWKILQGRRRFLKQGVMVYRTSQQNSMGKLQAGTYEVNFDLSEIKILHILVLNKWTKYFFFSKEGLPCSLSSFSRSCDPISFQKQIPSPHSFAEFESTLIPGFRESPCWNDGFEALSTDPPLCTALTSCTPSLVFDLGTHPAGVTFLRLFPPIPLCCRVVAPAQAPGLMGSARRALVLPG